MSFKTSYKIWFCSQGETRRRRSRVTVGLSDNYFKGEQLKHVFIYSTNIYGTHLVLSPVLGNRDAAKNLKIPVAMEATI